MYCRVLACDFDGTGAIDGRLAPEVAAVLCDARGRGIRTVLVTGRVLEDLRIAEVDLGLFDAVVAENGAVILLPAEQRTLVIADAPPERLLVALREQGIPFHAGTVVIGTWDRHAGQVLDLIRRLGLDQQLVFNRAALMLLPSGVDKAIGTARALDELGASVHNLVAFGDAENDLPLFAASEVAVAARGTVPAIAATADDQLSHPNGEGVAFYIRRLLDADCVIPSPARHRIVLGTDPDGCPVALPTMGLNVLISGDPRSGKSWLGGLLAERLLERGYRLCIIDPEGDHVALQARPHVLALGHDLPLPAPEAVAQLFAKPLSVVVSLATLDHGEKLSYLDRLLCALGETRRRTGLPHWTVIDEAHYFFHEGAPCAQRFDDHTGTMLFLTYRPSQLASVVLDAIGAYLVTHTEVEEERYFVSGLLQSRTASGLTVAEGLPALAPQQVGLLRRDHPGHWQVFTPAPRITAHVHHARKYLDEQLPPDKGFHFRLTTVPVIARNVTEFCRAVSTVPRPSLEHHLMAGDFSRWARNVLGDEELAAGLRKLEETSRVTRHVNPIEVIKHVEGRYAV